MDIGHSSHFRIAILEILKRDVYDIYCALSIWYLQLKEERDEEAPFILDREILIKKEFRKVLNNNKEKLIKYYDWTGRSENDGMWNMLKG